MTHNHHPSQAKLILVAGLPASGKTWFARALAEQLGAVHVNSDRVRSELGLRGQYDAASKQRVYDAMIERADAALAEGLTVITDSTFFKNELRRPWVNLAAKHNARWHFIEIKIPEQTARQRLQIKREDSEADWEVYLQISAEWEAIEPPHLVLDSESLPLEDMVKEAIQYLSLRP